MSKDTKELNETGDKLAPRGKTVAVQRDNIVSATGKEI